MTDIVIVAAARTAVGKFGGTLAKTPATELGAAVIRDLLVRAKLDGAQVGEVILGQVLQAGTGQNPARQSVIKSGLPNAVPAMTPAPALPAAATLVSGAAASAPSVTSSTAMMLPMPPSDRPV